MADGDILKLDIKDFRRCSSIWNMDRQATLAEKFYSELADGRRVTYVYELAGELVGEISLVFDAGDPLLTASGRRAYVSHLVVKKEFRRRGIGRRLLEHAVDRAMAMGLGELTVGVDFDNFPALVLYFHAGFDRIIFAGEDGQGQYLELMKTI